MLNRRSFIKALAAMGGVLLLPLDRLVGSRIASTVQAQPAVGELYEGFLLLPEGALAPSFVRWPSIGAPRLCGIGDGAGAPSLSALRLFNSVEDLAEAVKFPVYSLRNLPSAFRVGSVCTLHDTSGHTCCSTLAYETYYEERSCWVCAVSLSAFPAFPKPDPIWYGDPSIAGLSSAPLEKAGFLPTPGIRAIGQGGYTCYWIENNVLYTMGVDLGLGKAASMLPWVAKGPSAFGQHLGVVTT